MRAVDSWAGVRWTLPSAWFLLIVALAGSACLDPSQPTFTPEKYTGWWVLHLQGGTLDSSVELVYVHAVTDPSWPLRMQVAPSVGWSGAEVQDLACTTCGGRYQQNAEWMLQLQDGSLLELRYGVVGDNATGVYTLTRRQGASASGRLWGFRVDPTILLTPGFHASPSTDDSTPRVLLELDDLPATDPPLIERLIQRSLRSEERRVGKEWRCDLIGLR